MKPTDNRLEIVADDRERQADVIDHLNAMPNVTVSIQHLPEGDYLVNNKCLFERKTLNDFIISIIDGRLFNQSKLMLRTHYRPCFILEGTIDPGDAMHREAVQGAMIHLTVILGIPLLRSRDQEETARLICYTGLQISRSATGIIHRPGYHPKTLYKRKIFLLQGLPGIGPKRATRLLDHFGNIKNILTVTPDELAGIAGIGHKTATDIIDIISDSTNNISHKATKPQRMIGSLPANLSR